MELVNLALMRLLWMLIPILPFHDIVKANLGLPSSFVLLLLLLYNLVLIDQWES